MKLFKAIIVDDENESCEGMRLLLQQDSRMSDPIICRSGSEALKILVSQKIDLMLLDIKMPEMNGFELLKRLPSESIPITIFITAYDQFAIKAFEANAIDYLLKPFTDDRFWNSIKRALNFIEARETIAQHQQLMKTLSTYERYLEDSSKVSTKLSIKEGSKIIFIDLNNINYVQGYGNYLKVFSSLKTYVCRGSLHELQNKLSQDFVRIHKSFIINTSHISEIEPYFNGEFHIRLKNGSSIKSGRSYREKIIHLIGD